jgi:hypothetical protein
MKLNDELGHCSVMVLARIRSNYCNMFPTPLNVGAFEIGNRLS